MDTHAKSLDRLVARTMRQSQLHAKTHPECVDNLKRAIKWLNLARKFWAQEHYQWSDMALGHARVMVRWAIEDKQLRQQLGR